MEVKTDIIVAPKSEVKESEKVKCSCGREIAKSNLGTHKRSEYHKLNSPEEKKKAEEGGKLKAILDQMNQKLDHITEILDDIDEEMFGIDDGENQPAENELAK